MSASLPTPTAPAATAPRQRSIKAKLAHADLPAETTALIRDVVRKTRLNRREKRGVADELIAHFRDAAAAHTDPIEARNDFGDPAAAAQLIRRAKIRNRSMLYQGFIWTRRAAAAVVAIYLLLMLWMLGDRPQIKVDYLARVNAPIVNAPEHKKAWPIYRDAWIAAGGVELDFGPIQSDAPGAIKGRVAWPGTPEWADARRFLNEHHTLIAATRRGAALPHLGLALQLDETDYAPQDARALGLQEPTAASTGGQDNAAASEWIINAQLPQLHPLRAQARLLVAASGAALDDGDIDRAVDDLILLGGLARQASEPRFLVCNLVGVSILNFQTVATANLLRLGGTQIAARHLERLSRAIDRLRPNDLVHFDAERMFIDDTLQRMYTDNGRGGGRLTPKGLRLRAQAYPNADSPPDPIIGSRLISASVAPLVGLGFAGRDEVTRITNTFFELMDEDYNTPLWRQPHGRADAMIESWSTVQRTRHFLISDFGPALGSIRITIARASAPRDALRVALALHQHRAATHAWPADLAALAPQHLDALPVDPITGGPLRYQIVDDHPVIYSVGDDRDDDHGQPATGPDITDPARAVATWTDTDPIDGDWILYDGRPTPEVH